MMKMPKTRLSTRLTGSARETETRIRNIFQGQRRRPPALLMLTAALSALLCGSLISCQPGQDGPVIATQLQYYDTQYSFLEIPIFQLPAGKEEDYPDLTAVNEELTLLAQSYQYLMDAPWDYSSGELALLFPTTTQRYLNVTLYLGRQGQYGSDGDISTYVYDRAENHLLTVDDALTLAGVTREELLSGLTALVQQEEPYPRTASETDIRGFHVYDDGRVDFYLSAQVEELTLPEMAGWLDEWFRLYLWRDGEYRREVDSWNSCPNWLMEQEGLDSLSPGLYHQWHETGRPEGGFTLTARGESLRGALPADLWDAACRQAQLILKEATGVPPQNPEDSIDSLYLDTSYPVDPYLPLSTPWAQQAGALTLEVYYLSLQLPSATAACEYRVFYLPALRTWNSLTPLSAVDGTGDYYPKTNMGEDLHSFTPFVGQLHQRMLEAGVLTDLPQLEWEMNNTSMSEPLRCALFYDLTGVYAYSPEDVRQFEPPISDGLFRLDSLIPTSLHPLPDGSCGVAFWVNCSIYRNDRPGPSQSFYLLARLTRDRHWMPLGNRLADLADPVGAMEELAAAAPLAEVDVGPWHFFTVDTSLPQGLVEEDYPVTLYAQRDGDPAPQQVARLSASRTEGFTLTPFENVLGRDGVILSYPDGTLWASDYYAAEGEQISALAFCHNDIHHVDLNGNGRRELITSYYPMGMMDLYYLMDDGYVNSRQLNGPAARALGLENEDDPTQEVWVGLSFDLAQNLFQARWEDGEGEHTASLTPAQLLAEANLPYHAWYLFS